MSLIRKHGAVLQAWACLDLVIVRQSAIIGIFSRRLVPQAFSFSRSAVLRFWFYLFLSMVWRSLFLSTIYWPSFSKLGEGDTQKSLS